MRLARTAVAPVTALALAVATLTAPPAAAGAGYLEPTVTVAEGRSALPEAFTVVAASGTQVAVRLERSGVRLLSGPRLSVRTDLGPLAPTWGAGFVGDGYVAFEGDHALVVDVATGASTQVATVGDVVDGGVNAVGWLEIGAPGAPRALVLARLYGGAEVRRERLTDLPGGTVWSTPTVSPSGKRVLLHAGTVDTQVLVDVDVVAGTVTVLHEPVAQVEAVSDDAYVVATTDGFRERRGRDEARWPHDGSTVVLWDGRTIEGSPAGLVEVGPDGTRTPVAATPALQEVVAPGAQQAADALAWSPGTRPGVLRRVEGGTVTDALTMPAGPLGVRAVDVTAGTVRWLDDSATTVRGAGDVWARDLAGAAPRTLVVRRATGRSLVVDQGRTYATVVLDPAAGTFALARARSDADTQVLAPLAGPGELSAGDGRVAVSGDAAGVLVDTATGATSALPATFARLAGAWKVELEHVGPALDTTRVTATSGATRRVVDVPGWGHGVRATGTRLVVQASTGEARFATTALDVATAPATGTPLPTGPAEEVLAAAGGRVVTHDHASGDLVVRSAVDGAEVARLDTAGHADPAVGLDGEWVAWTTGPDGSRLVAAPFTAPGGPAFRDVTADHPFRDEIGWLVDNGIAEGYADGTFGALAPVSRQAMAAFLYRVAGRPAFTAPRQASFRDVPTTHPFFREIEWLAASGVAGGYADGTFKPGAAVSRQAMAAFLHRYAEEPAAGAQAPTFTDVPSGHQFRTAIGWLAGTGVTTGYSDGTYRPTAAVTRQAMAAFLYRYDRLGS